MGKIRKDECHICHKYDGRIKIVCSIERCSLAFCISCIRDHFDKVPQNANLRISSLKATNLNTGYVILVEKGVNVISVEASCLKQKQRKSGSKQNIRNQSKQRQRSWMNARFNTGSFKKQTPRSQWPKNPIMLHSNFEKGFINRKSIQKILFKISINIVEKCCYKLGHDNTKYLRILQKTSLNKVIDSSIKKQNQFIIKSYMSTAQITQEVQVSGSIISFNIFEQKLMRNFYIINTRLKKLDEINDLDLKIKGLEKELKFLSMKTETIAEKIPQEGSTLTKTDVKMISKEQIYEVLNSRDQKLMNTRFHDEIKKEIESLRVELAKIRIGSSNQKKQLSSGLGQKQASFTAGQVLLQESNKKILPKDSLQECLDPNQYNLVNDMVQGSQQPTGGIMEEINKRFEEMNLKIEEIKLAKIVKENGEKELERFERYEQYEDKSQQAVRKKKEKPIRLDGIKRENVRGEILKNQMFSQYQKAQLLKAEIARQPIEKKSLISKPANTFTNFNFKEDKRDLKVQERGEQKEKEKQKEREKSKRSRSLKRLERIQKRLKVDDSKDLNGVLREIQLRIQARVPHQVFMGFVHDIQEKLEILRITKDTSYDISELRKMIYSIETRLQAIISFLQNSTNEDDAIFVKKPWTCASCDKNLQKYSGKLGQHLNWQSVNAKKLSPMKAGAFGQTGQLANKIRTIMQSQRGGGE